MVTILGILAYLSATLYYVVVHPATPIIGVGNALAGILCWRRTKDIVTTILCLFLSWLYVVYWLFTYKKAQ